MSAVSPPVRAWHVVTCEYPPQVGGVADYTRLVADGFAVAGDVVHVWAPGADGTRIDESGVVVHRALGVFSAADLRRADARLAEFAAPRRLFVQWVPHGYGRRSLNLGFCRWLLRRARRHGDVVDLMVHEPFLEFSPRSWRQSAAAAVHRVMTAVLLRAARRVWVTIPAWSARLRPYAPRGGPAPRWLPVPSTVPVVADAAASTAARARYAKSDELLVGHFGTHGGATAERLEAVIPALLASRPSVRTLLIGPAGDRVRDAVRAGHPEVADRVYAAGTLPLAEVSHHLSACDMMLQPYPDGISTRRTSAMAALAHGRPTLTTAGHLTEPFWAESGAVALAPADDAAALAPAARALLDDHGRRDRMATAARDLYESRFAVHRVVTTLREARA